MAGARQIQLSDLAVIGKQCYSELSVGSGRADVVMQQGKGGSRGKVERQ